MTTGSKFENPSVVVSVDLLNQAFELQRAGCPVEDCHKPLISHSTIVNGSAAKLTFLCTRGHPTIWTSCEQLGRQALMLNRLVPAAAVMTGLKLAPMKRFMGLLQIDSHDAHYMKSSSLNVLVKLTQRLYDEEIAGVRKEMKKSDEFDIGILVDVDFRICFLPLFVIVVNILHYQAILTQIAMDEQHSRSQRKFGAAPYCTASFLNKDGLICHMVSVDDDAVAASSVLTKAGKAAKSKAKVAHCEGMAEIARAFKDSGCSLRHFCSDQATDACSDAESYFRPVWKDFRHNFDIWHKVKEFDSLWKTFCLRRLYPRGVFVAIP